MHGIQSIGLPPERHADRVVAEMMRGLAARRAAVWEAMQAAIAYSSDGSPKAQRKLEGRIRAAGAVQTDLTPGKRGKYELAIYDYTGWDAGRDEEIVIGDRIPEKPWIVCYLNILKSEGGGRERVHLKSRALVYITHHALSRMAQRLDMRTPDDLLRAVHIIWKAAIRFLVERGREWHVNAPPQGWRVPLGHGNDKVVLTKHHKHKALVATTVLD